MPSPFINQATSNQDFLDNLEDKFPDVFLDWKITVMFYIAVHLLKELAEQYNVDIGRTHEETAIKLDPKRTKNSVLSLPDKVWRCYRHLYRYSKEYRYDGLMDDEVKHESRLKDYEAAKSALSIFCDYMHSEGIKH